MLSQSKISCSNGCLQDEHGEEELERDAPEDHPPGQVRAVDGKSPSQETQEDHPEKGSKPWKERGIQAPGPLLPEVGLGHLLDRALQPDRGRLNLRPGDPDRHPVGGPFQRSRQGPGTQQQGCYGPEGDQGKSGSLHLGMPPALELRGPWFRLDVSERPVQMGRTGPI